MIIWQKFRAQSLQTQLLISLVFGVGLILMAFWWITQSALHNFSEKYVETRLQHDAHSIEEHILLKEGAWRLDHWSIGPIYLTLNSGHYYWIEVAGQTFKSPSLGAFKLQLLDSHQQGQGIYETRGPVENTLLVFTESFYKEGQLVTVYVAENHDPIREVLIEFDTFFAILTLFALLLLYGFQRVILNNVFNRLKPLEKQLQALQLGHDIKFAAQDYPQEVRSLIKSLNFALENLRQQFVRSRQHNSDLSHSLKTPLNLIFQLLESPQLHQYPALQRDLKQQAQRIYEKIEHELKAERIADYQMVTPLNIASLSTEVMQTLEQLYAEKSLNLLSEARADAQYRIDAEDAYELLGNLLDNACKWANSKVVLKADAHGFQIEDDGPGVSDEDLHKLEQRGFRLDETIPGHGIGLSIVKRIVEAYDMKIHFSHSPLGGLQVTVKVH